MWSWNTFCSCFVAVLFLSPGSVTAFILHVSPSLQRINKLLIVVQNPRRRTFETCRLNDSFTRTPNNLSHKDHDDLSSQAKDRRLYEMLLQDYQEMLMKGSPKRDENLSISSGDKRSTGNNYIVPSKFEKSKSIKTDKLVKERSSTQKKLKYYAVTKGHQKGIFFSWSKCEEQVKGYPGAHFKSFATEQEAKAFLNTSNRIITTTSSSSGSSSSHQPNNQFFGNNPVVNNSRSSTSTSTRSDQISPITSLSNLSHTYQVIIQFDGGSRGNPGRSGSGAVVQIKSNTTPTTKTTTTTKVTTTTTTTDTSSTISTSQTWYARSFLPQNATNNEAEYNGVIVGLSIAARELKKLTTVSQHNNDKSDNGNDNKDNNNSNSNISITSSKSSTKIENEDKERPSVELILQGDSKLVIQQLNKAWKVNKDSLKPYYNEAMRLIKQEIQPDKFQFLHVYREENRLADQLANEAMDTGQSWYTTLDDNHEQEMSLSFWIEKAGKATS